MPACRTCGALVERVPAGDEWVWVDDRGSSAGHDPEPLAALNWAADNFDAPLAAETYSLLMCRLTLGMLGSLHEHSAQSTPYMGEVPECCGWPAYLSPQGWICRVCRVEIDQEVAA